MTQFIGRDTDLQRINTLLRDPHCRLLTIVGPGGIGKTTLAREAMRQSAPNFADGVYFVDLTHLDDPSYFMTEVVNQIGLQLVGPEPPQTQLMAALQDRRVLLVLDNFEQIVEAAADLAALLDALPDITCLVTSRVVLHTRQEQLYPLDGMALPTSAADIDRADAVTLFSARAHQVNPTFALADHVAAVVRLCQLLEGVPLAIELAAAWVRVLTVADIVSEVEGCFDFLTLDARDLPSRHRSLRAVFQGSWGRLDTQQQAVLRRLTVFRGRFGRDAAATIADAPLRVLVALVDQSLVRADGDGTFSLHAVIREYAESELAASDEYDEMQRRHSHYYAYLTRTLCQRLKGRDQMAALAEMDQWIDNVRAGWLWAATHADKARLSDYLPGLALYHQIRSTPLQAADLIAVGMEHLADDHPLQLAMAMYRGWQLIEVGQTYRGVSLMMDHIHRETDLLRYRGLSLPLSSLSWHQETLGDDYARLRDILTANLAAAKASGDRWEMGFAHYGLGEIARMERDYTTADAHLQKSLEVFTTISDQWALSWPLGTLGRIAAARGDLDGATAFYEAAYAVCEAVGDLTGREFMVRELGSLAARRGDDVTASHKLIKSARVALSMPVFPATLTYTLQQIAYFFASRGLAVEAIEIAALLVDHPYARNSWWPSEIHDMQALLDSLAQTLAPADYQVAHLRGASSTLEATAQRAIDRLAGFLSETPPAAPAATGPSASDLLTAREMDVLRLLAEGLSNRQIADALTVTLGTVKTHVHNITGKLNAQNRTESVARAREIGLL